RFRKQVRRFRWMTVREFEDAEIGVRRRVARVEAERRAKGVTGSVHVSFDGLNGSRQVAGWRKSRVRRNRRLNRPAGGRKVLMKKLGSGSVVVCAATVWKEAPQRVRNGVEIGGVTRVGVQGRELFERCRAGCFDGDGFLCRRQGALERAAGRLQLR